MADGAAAEELAARELTRRGYRILARNVKSKVGELDIIAVDGAVLCFVEVRARADGTAAETVGYAKQRRLRRAAAAYLAGAGRSSAACRFDVVTLGPAGTELIKNAF